jgi:thiosulfate/3-mercaptopyruvate sulfurtransferase
LTGRNTFVLISVTPLLFLNMKNSHLFKFRLLVPFLLFAVWAGAQAPQNWTEDQLLQPEKLAQTIKEGKGVPVVVSIGPGAIIPGSVAIGMVNEKEGLEKLKQHLATVSKSAEVVIYCGCCPFAHCPNVRPAIALLKEMKFTNYYLLNLPSNIKKDWIDKGYPVQTN